jgi:hypothetical protein
VDWHRARVLFEAGWNPPSIAKLFTEEGASITRQAIAKRANKEGWTRCQEEEGAQAASAVPARQTAPAPASSRFLVPLTAEAEEALADSLRNGCTERIAAKRIGVTLDALTAWKDGDPAFAKRLEQAAADFAGESLGRIVAAGKRGDWKADQFMVQNHPLTKDEFGEKGKGGNGGLIVNLKFDLQRGAVPREEDIITIEPLGR